MATAVPWLNVTGSAGGSPFGRPGNAGRQSVSTSFRMAGVFLRVSICTSIQCAVFDVLTLDWMRVAQPVVSWPYMPAALIPMPCWPRDMRSRWNLEP